MNNMTWKTQVTNKVGKQTEKLSESVFLIFQVLIENLKANGPAPGKNWHNYGKLHGKKNVDRRHCHLVKENPTYVCCWEVVKRKKIIEVYYVGTHERAPY